MARGRREDPEFDVEDGRSTPRHAFIYEADWDSPRFRLLTPHARLVYVTLAFFVDSRHRTGYPKMSTLARICGFGASTVNHAVIALRKLGYLETTKRQFGTKRINVYRLLSPPAGTTGRTVSDAAVIEVGNADSRLLAPRSVIDDVRWFVSYQSTPLPPTPVQAEIRRVAHDVGRVSGLYGLIVVQSDPEVRRVMERCRFDPADLTVKLVESTMRQRHVWDGWTSLMSLNGVFPTGLLQHVERALSMRLGIGVEVRDHRGRRPEPQGGFQVPSLYEFQAEAVQAFLRAGRGVMDLPPRSGKTRIAIAIVAALGLPTVYLVPGIGLVTQTVEAFNAALPGSAIGFTGGRSKRDERSAPDKLVVVTTPGSAGSIPGVMARKLLVIDEFHHAAAETWKEAAKKCVGAWWRLGLTGTHFRADGRDLEMVGVLADTVYKRSVGDMVGLGRLVPARIAMLRVHGEGVGDDWYKAGVVNHAGRNATITYAANRLVQAGKRVLVLAKEIDHTQALAAEIERAVAVNGEDHEAVKQALDDLEAGRIRAVVGTSVIGEGRDVPGADALVYACGGKSRVKVTQDYFRVLTASPGKRVGIVVDIADAHDDRLTDHAAQRLALYRSEATFQADVMEWSGFDRWLADVA